MPPIPKYRRKRLPSTNVGAAPLPMSVDTGARAIGQGMQALGAGISNLGESLFKIKQADNRNKDLLAESQLSSAIKSAELDYKNLTSKDGDVNNYPGYRQQSIDKINSMKDTIEWGTTSAQKRAGILTSGWTSVFTKETEIGMVSKRSAETIKVTEANLIQSLSSLDDSEEQGIMNERSEAAYREALSFKYGPDQIDLIVADAISEGAKRRAINLASLGDFEEARKLINKTNFADPKDRIAALRSIESVALQQTREENLKYKETEKELHKQFIAGTLTKEENDRAFNVGESNVNTHQAYDAIIKNKELTDTDQILSEKWLNGSLTKSDITQAQKEGRLNNSSVVGAWLSRLNQGQFNAGAYDRALTKIREVQFDKGKYDTIRKYLLENAEDLGGKWDELRNKLETAMNAKGDSAGPHVARAHKYINDYAEDNPEINDGTLESISRIQKLHDDIDARADQTPEQMRNLTQALLLPYEEEKAKGWFSGLFEKLPPVGLIPWAVGAYARKRAIRSKERAVYQSVMLIQPTSKGEFKNKVTSLKTTYGDDSKEVKQFYDRYVDSYDWEIE